MGESEAYTLLGLSSYCSREDVEKAYRKKSLKFHPDLNPNKEEWATQQQKKLNTAYEEIKRAVGGPKSHERTKPWESQKQSSPSEQRAREQRAREQRAREQRAREQRAREQRAREQRAQEQRAQEQRAQEQRAQEQRAQEQRAQEQRAREQRAQEQRAQEQRAREQQAREQLAIEKRAAQICEARKNGTLIELLRSWGEHVPEKKKETQYKEWAPYKEWDQYHDDKPSPRKQNRTRNWPSGNSKQTQSTTTSGSQKSYSPENGKTEETSGLQRFGEFIRFLINEFIFLCLGG